MVLLYGVCEPIHGSRSRRKPAAISCKEGPMEPRSGFRDEPKKILSYRLIYWPMMNDIF